MIDSLNTEAEKRALKAEELPAFSGLKLLHIKRQVAQLLSLIGRDGIFDEYTRHDISHVDAMLSILDWLIPQDTKAIMSPADWLMIVLAIYFHDLGMLVTRDEFAQRNSSGFPRYRDEVLFAGDAGTDYRKKIMELTQERRERFLYQEFVRHTHAERIRDWVMGRDSIYLGCSHQALEEVGRLLSPLPRQCRNDLALVCESHHDDLNDFRKYKVSQPYGNSEEETTNLHYAAVLLRTADLLHITGDRTPSIVYRAVNPTDPLSQDEWAKQMAVSRVRSQPGRDREGNPDGNAARDTVEVHAFFTKPDGFFGLTSYLNYAQNEIRRSYDWAKEANWNQGARHQFPWRYINDENIEAEGFLPSTYEFSIDQAKVLDLLTGHTLYNDTKVVLRELVQNSLDAVRLQRLIDKQAGVEEQAGAVRIHWDSRKRILSVEDNGTGMTQELIEKHLLMVGASRYQDPDFRRKYPEFSSISRFGIGLLSAFMVADEVEIVTCHPEEEKARQLSLRSVHGKYLVRLLDKQVDETIKDLAPHGTLVKLRVRASAEMPDVLETAARWIVVPDCQVTVAVDAETPKQVGFSSPKDAVIQILQRGKLWVDGAAGETGKQQIKVEEKELDGVTLAYALRWSDYFRDWSFVEMSELTSENEREDEETLPLIGTCVEGVRVAFDTPGYDQVTIVAIANAVGSNSPKLNVVRSGFENTPERDTLLRTLYDLYCQHVKTETESLHQERKFSLTWAVQECRFLLEPILPTKAGRTISRRREEREVHSLNESLLVDSVRELPLMLVEQGGIRRCISTSELSKAQQFWTSDCQLFHSAEWLIREVRGQTSLTGLVNALGQSELQLPGGLLLCGFNSADMLVKSVLASKEVDEIRVYDEERRADLQWVERVTPTRWWNLSEDSLDFGYPGYKIARRGLPSVFQNTVLLGREGVNITGLKSRLAVKAFGCIYVRPDSKLVDYIISWRQQASKKVQSEELWYSYELLLFLLGSILRLDKPVSTPTEFVRDHADLLTQEFGWKDPLGLLDLRELYAAISEPEYGTFDPSAWARKES